MKKSKMMNFSITAVILSSIVGCVGVNSNLIRTEEVNINQSKNELPKSLVEAKEISLDLRDMALKNAVEVLGQAINTKIKLDEKLHSTPITLFYNSVKPKVVIQRMAEAMCLKYHEIDDNTLFIYPSNHQENCQLKPLSKDELAKNPTLQQSINFDDKSESDSFREPLSYNHYLYQIHKVTKIDMMSNALESHVIYLEANNQPAYKILQALSTANCFNIAQLSDKSLFLFPKPNAAKCEPVKNGTTITVE